MDAALIGSGSTDRLMAGSKVGQYFRLKIYVLYTSSYRFITPGVMRVFRTEKLGSLISPTTRAFAAAQDFLEWQQCAGAGECPDTDYYHLPSPKANNHMPRSIGFFTGRIRTLTLR
jgi:hypothetical protein